MRTTRPVFVLVVALALVTTPVVAGVGATEGGDATAKPTAAVPTATESLDNHTAPPDPETDVLGWEDGYWHNESISVNPEDGLNDTELEKVVARGMARVEYVRELEFEETPPVEIITRDAYTENVEAQYGNLTEADRLRHNVKYEALFMVNESRDSVAVERNNQAGGVGGYYDPGAEEIKVISNNVSTPKLDEITLAQELFHALQDQQYNLSRYNQTTRELHNAKDGIIEGDGNYVDYLYQQQCDEGSWNGTCLRPQDSGSPSDFSPHIGLYQILFQPYSTGPAFVRHIRQQGGWEAVNAIYENPPASTEQTIHPEKYGTDPPRNVSVPDTSQGPWRQLELNRSSPTANYSVPFAQFGEAGLFVALWYPGYETRGQTQVIPYNAHLNRTASGGVNEFQPYLYNHPATAGWDGDRLVPYVTNDSAETNETGYVYRLAWDSEADATDFRQTWLELMRFHGAEAVEGNQNTYRIADGQEFGDAFYVTQSGDTVTIVNGPTVADLSRIAEGAAPAAQDDGDNGTDMGTTEMENATDATTDGAGPGFTVVAAVLALLAAALAAGRRAA